MSVRHPKSIPRRTAHVEVYVGTRTHALKHNFGQESKKSGVSCNGDDVDFDAGSRHVTAIAPVQSRHTKD
jgi:hypothetical protein